MFHQTLHVAVPNRFALAEREALSLPAVGTLGDAWTFQGGCVSQFVLPVCRGALEDYRNVGGVFLLETSSRVGYREGFVGALERLPDPTWTVDSNKFLLQLLPVFFATDLHNVYPVRLLPNVYFQPLEPDFGHGLGGPLQHGNVPPFDFYASVHLVQKLPEEFGQDLILTRTIQLSIGVVFLRQGVLQEGVGVLDNLKIRHWSRVISADVSIVTPDIGFPLL